MKLKEMQAKETIKVWSILWHPEDWSEPSDNGTPAAALLFVVADDEEEARKATGLSNEDILAVQVCGFGGAIVA